MGRVTDMATLIQVTTCDSENWITINGAKVLVEGSGAEKTIVGGAVKPAYLPKASGVGTKEASNLFLRVMKIKAVA